ncbi:hypothetical protein [Mycolicibacterium baixiangningiae]|uniref:hypothetical protein n=1 Tax=Mycolicibacterium baixiangningiae TaxID=2761578 RepID=UPI0018D1C601|nr:hypothetical protein [Mycolicibacterium baixiangningiae]
MVTWCFSIGGFVSYYLGATPGTFAVLAGSLIGILLFLRPRGIGGYGASAPAERIRSDTTIVA